MPGSVFLAETSGIAQMIQLIIFAVLVLGGFYFILLRPALQQQRRAKRDLATLRPGDEILTAGGLIATVRDVVQGEHGEVELLLELGGVIVRAAPSVLVKRMRTAPRKDSTEETTGSGQTGVIG